MLAASIAFNENHNHGRCVYDAMLAARQLCQSKGKRLTPIRELVLELVWQSHQPLGAYELLPALASAGFNSAPPTVYRALDFLQELGLIHRINSLNAFVGCTNPQHTHPSGFMICRNCKTTAELDTSYFSNRLDDTAKMLGFQIEQETLELVGLCQNCKGVADDQS